METLMSYILYFSIAILYTEYVVELLWGGGGCSWGHAVDRTP